MIIEDKIAISFWVIIGICGIIFTLSIVMAGK